MSKKPNHPRPVLISSIPALLNAIGATRRQRALALQYVLETAALCSGLNLNPERKTTMPKTSPEYHETMAYLVKQAGNVEALKLLNEERRDAGLEPITISQTELALTRKANLMRDAEFTAKARRGDAMALAQLALLDAEIVTARNEEDQAEVKKVQAEVDAMQAAKPAGQ